MWNALKNAFKIPELRDRILFTFLALAIFRLGVYIPIPGINIQAWSAYFGTLSEGGAGGFIGFFDVFTGGAVQQFSIFLMSVTPYINAQIMLQLLTAVVPSLKYARYTRMLTVGLASLQGFLISFGLSSNTAIMAVPSRILFVLLATSTLIGGTMFLLWLGERITEKGIGNGISVLIFGGIVARYPASIMQIVVALSPIQWAILLAIALFTVIAVIYVQMGERRIEVQYARRVTGRRVYGGVSTHIPIKVNQGGVIPIIFSSAIMMLPQFIATAFPEGSGGRNVMQTLFAQTSPVYILLYGGMVFFFTFFYSSLVFDVREVSDNIRNYGGYIPGIRPGFSTQQYIQRVLNRVVFMGAVFLVVIALLPLVIGGIFSIGGLAIGGTSTLIAVGVAIDILQQMETHLMVRHYEGFVKKGKLRGRR
jgi:preprotein translocase subunit SecY